MKNLTKTIITLAASLTLITLLAGCSSATVSNTPNNTTPQATKTSAPAAPTPGTIKNPAKAGSTISGQDTLNGTYDITYSNVNLDATAAVAAANQFNDAPAAGNKFISVDVTVKNTNTDTKSVDPGTLAFGITFVDPATGKSYTPNVAAAYLANPLTSAAVIYPGTTATGSIIYEVPTTTTTGDFVDGGVFVAAN